MTTHTNDPAPTDGIGDGEREWHRWRTLREASLAQPHGWRSLTALHWLDGARERLPELPGTWWYDAEGVWVEADPEGPTVDGVLPVGPALVLPEGGVAADVRAGERALEVIDRGLGLRGVRVRDPRAVPTDPGVPTFDYAPEWVVTGWFEPYPSVRRTTVGSAADGVEQQLDLVGEVVFERDGGTHRLAVGGGGSLAFRDATSGRETYGLLRFARAEIDGTSAVLDFNRAVNPPCAFTDFGTCPFPPPGNTLALRVTAGERTPTPTG